MLYCSKPQTKQVPKPGYPLTTNPKNGSFWMVWFPQPPRTASPNVWFGHQERIFLRLSPTFVPI